MRLDNDRYTRLRLLALSRHTTPEQTLADLVDDAAERADIARGHQPGDAAKRLAEALGWKGVPELTEAEKADADARLAAAEAEAHRIYGPSAA